MNLGLWAPTSASLAVYALAELLVKKFLVQEYNYKVLQSCMRLDYVTLLTDVKIDINVNLVIFHCHIAAI